MIVSSGIVSVSYVLPAAQVQKWVSVRLRLEKMVAGASPQLENTKKSVKKHSAGEEKHPSATVERTSAATRRRRVKRLSSTLQSSRHPGRGCCRMRHSDSSAINLQNQDIAPSTIAEAKYFAGRVSKICRTVSRCFSEIASK